MMWKRKMNKWEMEEYEQWSEKVRSQRFSPPLLDKNGNYMKGCDQKEENRSLSPCGLNGSNFKNETLFVSFTAIITTRNG